MVQVSDVADYLREVAPPDVAEEWDNVGLLIGDKAAEIENVLTCLTLTPDVAEEAIRRRCGLVVSHHPVLFRPVKRLTADSIEGDMLLDLIAAGTAVFSPHTGYDSAQAGINFQLAQLFELQDVQVLRPKCPDDPQVGAGRFGRLPQPLTLRELHNSIKQRLCVEHMQFVGDPEARIERLAIACGSAAEFLRDSHEHGCQALLTGEARFHACLEARALEVALILPGHYATERPAMELLAERLGSQFPQLKVQASEVESDPLQWI